MVASLVRSLRPRRLTAPLLVLAVATVWIVWGATFLGIRVMVETIPPLVGSAGRFLAGGSALVLVALWIHGRGAFRLSAEQWRGSAAMGLLLVAGGVGLFAVGEHMGLPSSLAALIASAEAAIVLALRIVAGRERVSPATAFGVGIGAVGVILLLSPGSRPAGVPLTAALLGLAGSLTWATGTYLGARIRTAPDVLTDVAIQMLAGGTVLLVAGLAAGERIDPGAASTRSLVALVGLTIASVAVYAAYAWLLRNASLSLVTTQSYVNPVVAVVLGVLVLGETVGLMTGIGMGITLVAVVLVLRADRHDRPPTQSVESERPDRDAAGTTLELPVVAGPARTA
ncbi:EamA family transporter [Patulibacter sp. NPDC049589]|uniref:EamA family transporter n=1 Tax=Patulibacter sp. NPDC049589 TaxID=3154731 RepID=UPI00343889D8